MLKLNTDEERSLQFEINIQGIDHKQLQGRLKFIVDNIEYGFPVEILSDYISTVVPPLDDIIKSGLEEGKEIECKLDVSGNGFHLTPWSGRFQLKTPVRMEAKMMADTGENVIPIQEKKIDKEITVKLKEEDAIEEQVVTEKHDEIGPKEIDVPRKHEPEEGDDLTKDEILEMLEKILIRKNKKITSIRKVTRESKSGIEEVVNPPQASQKKLVEVVSKTGRKYKVNQKVASKIAEIQTLVDRKLSKKSVKKKRVSENSDRTKLESGNKDPIKFMESLGMKNKTIQKVMLEKAEAMGGDDKDSQYAALERLLGTKGQRTVVEEMEKVHESIRFSKT